MNAKVVSEAYSVASCMVFDVSANGKKVKVHLRLLTRYYSKPLSDPPVEFD
jgi:hypothetical protein